jgi:hypothetical protein
MRNLQVWLALRGQDLDPDSITAALRIPPSKAFRRGDLFYPGGKPMPRAFGFWSLSTEGHVVSNLAIDHCRWLVASLSATRERLEVFLRDDSLSVAVSFWWEPEEGPNHLKLGASEIRALSELCNEFEIYFA